MTCTSKILIQESIKFLGSYFYDNVQEIDFFFKSMSSLYHIARCNFFKLKCMRSVDFQFSSELLMTENVLPLIDEEIGDLVHK